MITIYHVPGTRSVRPIWLCEELDLPYHREVISFDAEFRASPEWRRLNPVGKVPVMIDGDLTLFESCAMVQVIHDRYGKGRFEPERGSNEHALMQQWSWFAESTLARPAGEIVNHRRMFGDNRIPEVMAEMADRIRLCLAAVDEAMAGRDFLVDYGLVPLISTLVTPCIWRGVTCRWTTIPTRGPISNGWPLDPDSRAH